jgi:hypothetical protein
MSYFDPDIYNYEGLIEKDKRYMDGFDAAIEEISEGCDEYIIDQVCAEHEDAESIAGQMKRELIDAVFSHLLTVLEGRRQNIIVSMIDGYDDE